MENRKRILFTIDSYAPRIGGAEIHLIKLREKLYKLGYQSEVITTEPLPPKRNEPDVYRLRKTDWIGHFTLLNNKVRDADIVHSHYASKLATLAGFSAKIHRKPFVLTIQGHGILDQPKYSKSGQLFHKFYRIASLKLADQAIATSQELADLALKHMDSAKMNVISNGVEQTKLSPMKPERYSLATFRRLVDKNGVHYIVQAAPFIKKRLPAVKIDLYGDGYNREKIKTLIKELHVEDVVTLKGAISHDKVIQTMSQYDGIVFPSTAEARSLACLEAMMAGRIVIASNLGGLAELIGRDKGYLTDFLSSSTSTYKAKWITSKKRKFKC